MPIAGIAWAPDRGISRVEVGIDGTWYDARLSRPISDTTWVQWVLDWAATPGDHTIQVRATDGAGPDPDRPRRARRRRMAPAGWDTRSITVG